MVCQHIRNVDHGQGRAFRFLWFFLPEPSVARDIRFEALLVSRFLSDAGQQALASATSSAGR